MVKEHRKNNNVPLVYEFLVIYYLNDRFEESFVMKE